MNELSADGLVTSDLLLSKTVAFSTGEPMNINGEPKNHLCSASNRERRGGGKISDREKKDAERQTEREEVRD